MLRTFGVALLAVVMSVGLAQAAATFSLGMARKGRKQTIPGCTVGQQAALRRGVHTSVKQLEADIRSFIDRHNQNPRPFKWTKSADQILASVKRFCHKAQQTLCSEL